MLAAGIVGCDDGSRQATRREIKLSVLALNCGEQLISGIKEEEIIDLQLWGPRRETEKRKTKSCILPGTGASLASLAFRPRTFTSRSMHARDRGPNPPTEI